MMIDHYTHDTIPCEELDRLALLKPEEQVGDPIDRLIECAQKAQIHLEMRLDLLRAEEEEQRS